MTHSDRWWLGGGSPREHAQLEEVVADRTFDLVCAHGVLMYIPDRRAAVQLLANRVARLGRLSFTARNAHGLAFRPAMRGDWPAAIAAFSSDCYVNELGLTARADRVEDISHDLATAGFSVERWYGVRVFNDVISPEALPPPAEELTILLDAEDHASRTDPYRWFASQLHFIAKR